MKHLRTILVAGAVAAGVAACSDSSGGPFAPEAPRYNGFTFGSGHRTTSDSTSAAASGETTADDGSTQRGGFTYGSGH